MASRTRALAALIALIALTFSFAESVWASSCMPAMEMSGTPGDATDTPDGCMVGMPSYPDEPGDRAPDRPDVPHCPFAPLSTSGTCVVAASLPAPMPPALGAPPEGELLTPFLHQTRDLLLVAVLFHPPRV